MEPTKEEFKSCMKILNNISQKIKFKEKEYIFLLRMNQNDEDFDIIMNLFSENEIYKIKYNYNDYLEYKKKLGLEGKWEEYFLIIKNGIKRLNGGDILIDKISKNKLYLKILLPLGLSIRMSSFYELSQVTENLNIEYFKGMSAIFEESLNHAQNQAVDFNLTQDNEKESKSVMSFEQGNQLTSSQNISSHGNSNLNSQALVDVVSKKRKCRTNLIMPNIKKRHIKRPTFIEEESKEDEDDDK